jgi:hypothetical protein
LPPHRLALPVETLLTDTCNGTVANVANMGGQEERREAIQLGPHVGKELSVFIPRANGRIISRFYIVGGRLYMAMCGGSGHDVGHANVKRFFESFTILDAGAGAGPMPPPVAGKGDAAHPRAPAPAPAPQPAVPPLPAFMDLPPLPAPVPITPAPVKTETAYPLPEPVRSLRVGGGGRFLILHFPKARQIGVFDVNEARIVRSFPAGEDDMVFAAGMSKLILYLPGAKVAQRFDLLTGAREHIGHLDLPDGKIEAFCMGHASAGPLLVSSAGQGVRFYNPETFQFIPRPAEPQGPPAQPAYLEACGYWAGATGRLFGSQRNYTTVTLEGGRVKRYGGQMGAFYVMPGPDDRHVYPGGQGIVSEQGKPVANVPYSIGPNLGNAMQLYLPAHHGPFYLHMQTLGDLGPTGEKSPNGTIRVYVLGQKEPILTILKTVLCPYGWDGVREIGIERSVHLIPQAKLLVIVPAGRKELHLYPTDLDAALEASGGDYLFFTSFPPPRFEKGKTYTYQAAAKARRGPVTFRVAGAPPGMTVDSKGLVTWPVPATFGPERAEAILIAIDAVGHESFQSLALTERSAP